MRSPAIAISMLVILTLAGGCARRSVTDADVFIPLTGPVMVDVESFAGDVEIRTDPTLTAARIRVKRSAKLGYRRAKDSLASLDLIDYSIKMESGESGPVLAIRTWTAHTQPYFQYCHVRIDLPAVDGVNVHTNRGKVTAVNVQGTIEISTNEEFVRVLSNLPLREAVTITNTNGDIDYRVRGESTGAFDCASINGRVDARVMQGRFPVNRPNGDRLLGVLNDGVNPIVLRTVDGNIRVSVVHNPTEVGLFIFDP